MKYIKLFLLLAAAPFIASCSSDDDDYNSAQCTISFQSETLKTKESAGYFNIPISVEGVRNGEVNVTLVTTPAETNGAIEGEHYRITDKTLCITTVDTASTATINVQVQALDNPDINEDRSFTIAIASANGADVKTSQITVVLRDNDAAFYEKFHGKWILTGTLQTSSGTGDISKTVTISGAIDEEDPAYNKLLKVSAPKFLNVGVDLELTWNLQYYFDQASKQGTLSVICGEEIASYGGVYSWTWATVSGNNPVAEWGLGDNDAFPTTITFPTDEDWYFYGGTAANPGTWAILSNVTLIKQ